MIFKSDSEFVSDLNSEHVNRHVFWAISKSDSELVSDLNSEPVDRHVFWAISKSDSEFVSDPNSELLVSFSSEAFCLIKRGIVPIDYNLNLLI